MATDPNAPTQPAAGTWTGTPQTSADGSGTPIPWTNGTPQTAEEFARNPQKFNPSGWTKTGGNSSTDVYVSQDGKTTVYVDRATGRVQDSGSTADFNRTTQPGYVANSLVQPAATSVKDAAGAIGADLGINTTGIGGQSAAEQAAQQNLINFANQLQTTRDNYGGGTTAGAVQPITAATGGPAAQMTAAQTGWVPNIDTSQIGATSQQITAPTIGKTGGVTANKISGIPQATAQTVATPGAVNTPNVTAQQIGPVGLQGADANAASVKAAQDMLAGAAAGNAPSAAEQLMRKAIDENAGTALGMAATLQGSRPGMALRQGIQGANNAIAKSAADIAAQRAAEQATAREAYATMTQGVQGQNIQAATANLQAQVDTLKANQSAALQAGDTNAANAIQAQIATLQAQLDASKTNASNALQTVLANQSNATDVAKANQAASLQAQIVSLQAQLDVAKQNAANALAAGQSNQAAALQAQIQTMQAQLDAAKANQTTSLSTATTNAGLEQQANLTNAQLAQNQSQFGATAANTVGAQNQTAGLQQQQVNNQQYLGLTQLQQQAYLAPYQAMLQQDAANQAFLGGLISAGGQVLAASDVTLKTDIQPGAEAALAFLDALPDPVTYRYRDERTHYPGKQLGVIAQDLPKAVVTTGPDGKKWISANVIGQVLAGLGTVHRRIAAIEGNRKDTGNEAGTLSPLASRRVIDDDMAEFARRLAS